MSFSYTNLKPKIGATIHADKQTLLSGTYAAKIRELLEQRGVLVFPRINFTDDEQKAFTATLGRFANEIYGEDVFKITLDPKVNPKGALRLRGSLYWHIDGTMNQVPIRASLLSSKVLSPTGGDTEFCNTYAAYDDLPAADKQAYESLRVLHAAWNSLFYYDPEPDAAALKDLMDLGDRELPLVWTHKSGRKSLVLGCTAYQVVGMDRRRSTELLVKLRDWATQPQFVYVHKWSLGDLVMWDNTGTMHRARPYDPDCGRLLHRTLVQGEEALA